MKPVHILCERLSPNEALIWTMWCSDQCVHIDNEGHILPDDFDFLLEQDAAKATCERCRHAFEGGEAPTRSEKRPEKEKVHA